MDGVAVPSGKAFCNRSWPQANGFRLGDVLDVDGVRREGLVPFDVSRENALSERCQTFTLPRGRRAAVCRRSGRVMRPAARPVRGQFTD